MGELAKFNPSFNEAIDGFEKMKSLAEYLAHSDTFVQGFEVKDKLGKAEIDESTGKPKINVTDIALCLMAGYELNLSITGSLLLGKKLNQATYMAITKGKALGLDVATAMEKVVSIPTQNGLVTYTMVDIISGKLIQGGVCFLPFIKNYAPFYVYYNAVTKEELDLDKVLDEDDNLSENYFLIDSSSTADSVKIEKEKGKIAITRTRHGYYSKAKFVRTFSDGRTLTHYQRFSTLDAERAGLLPTYDAKGVELTKGKSNWITNTPQMMNNRLISIGGRIIGADLINGIYTQEEVMSAGIIGSDTVDTAAEIV